MVDDSDNPKQWWQNNVIKVITPFQKVLQKMNMEEDEMWDTLSNVFIYTCSSSQLGTLYNMLEVPEGRNAYKPKMLRTKIKKVLGEVIPDRLAKWQYYLSNKILHKAHRGSCQYIVNHLDMMSNVERAKHERFAQLLIHLPDEMINEYSSTIVPGCLKRLQYENQLKPEPYPPNRYDPVTAQDRKKPAACNPASRKYLYQRWIGDARGVISLLEKDQWKRPREGEHVMKTIPHILESTRNNRELITDMCSWALEIEEHEDTFQTEAYTDGDVFQAMAALARVKFFGIDSSSDDESQSASSNDDNSQNNEGKHEDNPGSGKEDDEGVHVDDPGSDGDSDDSGGSVKFLESGSEDSP